MALYVEFLGFSFASSIFHIFGFQLSSEDFDLLAQRYAIYQRHGE